MKKKISFIFVLLVISTALFGQELSVCGIQFQIDNETVLNQDLYTQKCEDIVAQAVQQGADIIVFPEYLSVFPFLFNLTQEELTKITDKEWVIGKISEKSLEVQLFLDEYWSGVAEHYGVYILAGTTFISDEDNIYNRALFFDSEGSLFYFQDKVYLTPFEKNFLGMTEGLIDNISPLIIEEKKIGISICRDTFFTIWEDLYQDVDLWIDIKANGTLFTEDQESLFQRALPARIQSSQVPLGMTICLTGSFEAFLWQGRSSIVKYDNNGIIVVDETNTFDQFETLTLNFGDVE